MKCKRVDNKHLGDNFMYPIGANVENGEGQILGVGAAALIELGINSFRKDASPGTFVDVGANFGIVSKLLAKSGLFKHIDAFECNPNIATVLEKNLSNERITTNILNRAVGDTCEIIDFIIPAGDNSSFGSHNMFGVNVHDHDATGCDTLKINKITLDSYYNENHRSVSAMKVDVEGYEYDVLMGAKDLIMEHRPIIVYECLEIELHQATHRQLWQESGQLENLSWCKLLAGTDSVLMKDRCSLFLLNELEYEIQAFPWSRCDILAVPRERRHSGKNLK